MIFTTANNLFLSICHYTPIYKCKLLSEIRPYIFITLRILITTPKMNMLVRIDNIPYFAK